MENTRYIVAADFGLTEENVVPVEKAFAPSIAGRKAAEVEYAEIIAKEINAETCAEARILRLKLVKVRTGIKGIHTTQKAFALAFGKLVDAWKNKETLPVEQMEAELMKREKHFENIEAERIKALTEERSSVLIELGVEYLPANLAHISNEEWKVTLHHYKVARKAILAAEKKEAYEKKAKLKAKAESDKKIRLENERLKKEAAERERLEAERVAKEEAKREKRAGRMQDLSPFVAYIRDYDLTIELSDTEFEQELESLADECMKHKRLNTEKEKAAAESRAKKAEERLEIEANLKSEREERERLERENAEREEQARKDQEDKETAEREEAKRVSDQNNRKKVESGIIVGLMGAGIIDRDGGTKKAEKVLAAIIAGNIPSLTINY